MENRKIVSTPVSDEAPLKAKPDDFEPLQTTNNPLPDDRPTSPPNSYGCDGGRPDVPPGKPGK